MNAVERVLLYTELKPEGDAETPNDPPASWPEQGEIQFIDATLTYHESLPLVLKRVSFEIKPSEKVPNFWYCVVRHTSSSHYFSNRSE